MPEAMRRLRIGVALAAAVAAMTAGAEGRAEAPAPLDRQAVGEIVREYLIENPGVIEEAMRALRAKRDAARQQVVRRVMERNRSAIFSHPMTPVSGDAGGDVTLVEFFDYQCGYCIGGALARDEPVTIAGFGKFTTRSPAARQGRNPRTGERGARRHRGLKGAFVQGGQGPPRRGRRPGAGQPVRVLPLAPATPMPPMRTIATPTRGSGTFVAGVGPVDVVFRGHRRQPLT